MTKINNFATKLLLALRYVFMVSGVFFLLLLIIGATSLPFWLRYNLATTKAFEPENTQSILIMGGGGFPSESVLIRLWYAARLAHRFPDAKIVVTTPGFFSDSSSTVFQMYDYLINQQVHPSRIVVDSVGLNTRYQALIAYSFLSEGIIKEPLLIVTSPAHVYRTVKSFEKAGFTEVSGRPAMEAVLETDLKFDDTILGGNTIIKGASKSISIRYTFWEYLTYEVEIVREYIAIAYYKLKGWI